MDNLINIIKWYLLATVISAVYGVLLSINYITDALTQSQGQYFDLLMNIVIACLYVVAFAKTISTLRAMPNNSIQPTANASAD